MSSDNGNCSGDRPELASDITSAEELNSDTVKRKFTLRFITWNVEGLDIKNLIPRTEAVCKEILKEQADIIFLQEVIPTSAKYFRKRLADYHCLFGKEYGYFVGTFLKKASVSCTGSTIIEFTTRMMRNCLQVNAVYKEKNLVLFNSHIESTDKGVMERKEQLRKIFEEVLASPGDTTAIFGGDLNCTDEEITELGGLPAGIDDLWIACGSPKECEYTWNMEQNDNLVILSKPRRRYDRVYVRHSSPCQLKPTYFGLIGLQRLQPELCFPSDHWGLLSHFEVEASESLEKKKSWWRNLLSL